MPTNQKMPIIFFRIAWMRHYQGQTGEDRVKGAYKFVLENDIGHEQYNFLPSDGYMYGHVPLIKDKHTEQFHKININKLGTPRNQDEIDNITVVFISRNPSRKKGQKGVFIVGWYRNATVFRKRELNRVREFGDINISYMCKTKSNNAYCVPEAKRNEEYGFRVPAARANNGKGGFGRSTIWYGEKPETIRDDVQKYIDTFNQ